MALTEYTAKRRFGRTPEPPPDRAESKGGLRFVVHKHAARALHYDLRLELDGVLKSWAVPKGPSLDPSVKRMAVMVEDHPLAYGDFEGLIPEGNYGAGSVIIWDRGTYRYPAVQDEQENRKLLGEGLRKGNLKFVLEGGRLHGAFALVRMGKDGKSWLLMKKKDRYAGDGDLLKENRSVVSHKTLEDMLGEGREDAFRLRKTDLIRLREAEERGDLKDAPIRPMPHGVMPMLAAAAAGPFNHPDWIYEVKWDGYRAIAEISGDGVSLSSRNGTSFNRKFAPIVDALRKIGADAVLDGEIVVVDGQGRPDFQRLQHYQASGAGHLLYYLFDMLHFEGHDLTGLPLIRRKELLKSMLPSSARLRFSDHVVGEGVLFYRVSQQRGLEGIIAKHTQSAYEPGARTREWLKVKARRTQEGVIAGFTAPGGGRRHFGSLVLGVYEGGSLVPIGSVGSGFTEKDLQSIHSQLEPLARAESPFPVPPGTNAPVAWVRPELVCEVELAGWTEDGSMRQPVFLRLREDKTARDVVRERPLRGGEGGP